MFVGNSSYSFLSNSIHTDSQSRTSPQTGSTTDNSSHVRGSILLTTIQGLFCMNDTPPPCPLRILPHTAVAALMGRQPGQDGQLNQRQDGQLNNQIIFVDELNQDLYSPPPNPPRPTSKLYCGCLLRSCPTPSSLSSSSISKRRTTGLRPPFCRDELLEG